MQPPPAKDNNHRAYTIYFINVLSHIQQIKLKGDEVSHYTYHIQATLIENEIFVKNYRNQAGRFILATNLLDEETNLARVNLLLVLLYAGFFNVFSLFILYLSMGLNSRLNSPIDKT